MYKILRRKQLNDTVVRLDVEAPFIANKAKAGQFIILRIDERGERMPLTIADTNAEEGSVSIIFQIVGQTTMLLSQMNEGDCLLDFVGPLGAATEFGHIKKACVIGGGVGNAIAYPSAKALFNMGVDVDVIAGFRSKDIVILEDEYKEVCNRLFITTDDGTYGEKGFVTNKLQDLIDAGNNYDLVIAIGPIPMMKFVSKVTEPYNIKTLVSLNPIMIDVMTDTGMSMVPIFFPILPDYGRNPTYFRGRLIIWTFTVLPRILFSPVRKQGRMNWCLQWKIPGKLWNSIHFIFVLRSDICLRKIL